MRTTYGTTRKVLTIFRDIIEKYAAYTNSLGVEMRIDVAVIKVNGDKRRTYFLDVEGEYWQGCIASYDVHTETLWINNSKALSSKTAVVARQIASKGTHFNELFNLTNYYGVGLKVDSSGMTQNDWERNYRYDLERANNDS